MNKTTSLKNFRKIAFLEGVSYLLLLLVAMPLKYFAGIVQIVKYIGWIHGVLFIAYCLLLVQVTNLYKWGFKKIFLAFIASLLPFGTFILDAKMLKSQEGFE